MSAGGVTRSNSLGLSPAEGQSSGEAPGGTSKVAALSSVLGKRSAPPATGESPAKKTYKEPKIVLECEDDFIICEENGNLVVYERSYEEDFGYSYTGVNHSVEDLILSNSCRVELSTYSRFPIERVLEHEDFEGRLYPFLDRVFVGDGSEAPKIFNLTPHAALQLLEIQSRRNGFDPLKVVDPTTNRNIFTHPGYLGNIRLLTFLSKTYPQHFLSVGEKVIEEMLKNGQNLLLNNSFNVPKEFEKVGGKIDPFLQLWIDVANGKKPEKNSITELTQSQQRQIYDAAVIYRNPFIHEPQDPPISQEDYTVNLVWVNPTKISEDDRCIFGKNSSNFEERFFKSVTQWAKKQCGSEIHVWVDGEMIHQVALDNTRLAVENALADAPHAPVIFRDVRSIDLVKERGAFFEEKVPVYLRVDLLRAIAMDHVLKTKERKFFVYADLDMEPLTPEELFDKRTVGHLKVHGFALAQVKSRTLENAFFIFNGDNKECIDTHREIIIDLPMRIHGSSVQGVINPGQIYQTYPAFWSKRLIDTGILDKKHKETDWSKVFDHSRIQSLGSLWDAKLNPMPTKVVLVNSPFHSHNPIFVPKG